MSYQPSFFEVFLAWTVVVVWSRWLLSRGAGALFEWLPWIVGVIVLLGQVVASVALLSATSGEAESEGTLTLARWGPFAAVGAALALELAATLEKLTRRST